MYRRWFCCTIMVYAPYDCCVACLPRLRGWRISVDVPHTLVTRSTACASVRRSLPCLLKRLVFLQGLCRQWRGKKRGNYRWRRAASTMARTSPHGRKHSLLRLLLAPPPEPPSRQPQEQQRHAANARHDARNQHSGLRAWGAAGAPGSSCARCAVRKRPHVGLLHRRSCGWVGQQPDVLA